MAMPTASGEVVDYHSLRHSFITWLSLSGTLMRVVQLLARHSTLVLPMNTYSHPKMANSRMALESVPVVREVTDTEKATDAVRATGNGRSQHS